MKPQYYIGLMPKMTQELCTFVQQCSDLACYPQIRLPLHTTVYFLGTMSSYDKERVLTICEQIPLYNVRAKVTSVGYFGVPTHTCYLGLESPEILQLHEGFQQCADIHQDAFEYVPHLSLFFPQQKLSEQDKRLIEQWGKKMRTIEFEYLYVGSVYEGGTTIEYKKYCLAYEGKTVVL